MISILLELQRLKRVDRTGWTLRGQAAGAETVAAHTFGVAVAAMLLADHLLARGVAVDVERLLRLSIIHDWAEARTSDLPRAAAHYFGTAAREQGETLAFADIVQPLGEQARKRYAELFEDYKSRATLEAKLVKAADIIDLLAQALAFERAGVRGLDEFWENALHLDLQLDAVSQQVVGDTLQSLIDARAQAKI